MSDAQAASFEAQGFEIAFASQYQCAPIILCLHCKIHLLKSWRSWHANFPSISAPVTCRKHCLAWGDWASAPKAELQNGIRLDANYYYWPASWVQNRPGMFTGSGMPDAICRYRWISIIDVYQAGYTNDG